MSTKTYRKKPEHITAVRWDGGNRAEVLAFVGNRDQPGKRAYHHAVTGGICVPTPSGAMWAYRGDYIIKSATGELCVYDAAAFREAYEEVTA